MTDGSQQQERRAEPTASGPLRHGHDLGKAAVGIAAAAAGAALVAGAARFGRGTPALPPAVSGERKSLETGFGTLSFYVAGPDAAARQDPKQPPMLLVHCINAAGSAYEVKPFFEHYRATRTVYALDLPGFGFSARRQRLYTPRLMTDAILAMAEAIRGAHGDSAIDALALSLSSEFLARAAVEQPDWFRTLGLVSPTGFDRRAPRTGPKGSNRGMPAMRAIFADKPWSGGLFRLLTSRVSIRYFLEKTWGSKAIDEGMVDYDYLTTRQPGAEHAPFSFISGYLFSNDITRIYDALSGPVWMAHGVRGDFTDYTYKRAYEGRPNWHFDVFQTGALPHFERPDDVFDRYDAFRAASTPDAGTGLLTVPTA